MRLFAIALLWGMAFAQDPPPTPPPPPPPPVLENSGKPMLLPFQCTDEDIQLSGLTCSEEDPCPIYLELSRRRRRRNRAFSSRGTCTRSAVTVFSTLLASDDGGRTWREAHERIRSAGLDRIQFLDAGDGLGCRGKALAAAAGSVPAADVRRRKDLARPVRSSARPRRTGWAASSSSSSPRRTTAP